MCERSTSSIRREQITSDHPSAIREPDSCWRCAVACSLASGCANLPWRKVSLEANSGFYSDAALTYRLDAGRLALPLDVVRVEGQRLIYEQVASSPLPEQSIGTLTLEYPHPTGKAGWALVQFTLDSGRVQPAAESKSWNPLSKKSKSQSAASGITSTQPEVHETWELEIPATEAEGGLQDADRGRLLRRRSHGHRRQLTVRMNGRETAKDWNQLPALNLLGAARARAGAAGGLFATDRRAGSDLGANHEHGCLRRVGRLARSQCGTLPPGANAFAMAMPPVAGPAIAPRMPTGPGSPVGPQSPYPPAIAQRPGSGVR